MLQKVDARMTMLLGLADAVEKAEDFDQGNWHHCICGQAVKLYGDTHGHPLDFNTAYIDWGSDVLGISHEQARQLFCNYPPVSREQAARVIRHLAHTGEVNWSRVLKCAPSSLMDAFNSLWGERDDSSGGEVLSDAEPLPVPDLETCA